MLSPEALEKRHQRERLKNSLRHIKETISKREWQNALKRYQGVPDKYYHESDPVGPNDLSSHSSLKRFRPKGGQPAESWEIMAGPGALSAGARSKQMTHLPPIDHRWGWHVGRYADQLRLLILQVLIGCGTLFASPSCHPWGANARATTPERRHEARHNERQSLQFLAVMLLAQCILGRTFVVEQPEGSDLLKESPLAALVTHTTTYSAHLHQCMYGKTLLELPARKATELTSNRDIQTVAPELTRHCDKSHSHQHIRGPNAEGVNLSSLSAMYPPKLVEAILKATRTFASTPTGGSDPRRSLHSFKTHWGGHFNFWSRRPRGNRK